MASTSLRALAGYLGVPERTLRRAAADGVIRGERISPRRYVTTLREEDYLRRHWPLLRDLRDALRTEPNVRLAVLFGSHATGRVTDRSDIDLLVILEDPSAGRVADLSGRLEDRMERPVQLVRLEEAGGSPALMNDILGQGRVMVDRDDAWTRLRQQPTHDDRGDLPLDQLMPDLHA
jgi:predicted nucleotidyltransferase